jgi:hypothetical protein
MSASDFFGDLPKADQSYDTLESRRLAPPASSIGMTVGNLATKAAEGVQDAASRFGTEVSSTFTKFGALVPTMSQLTSPGGLKAALGTVAGSLFGTSGLTSKAVQDKLVGLTAPGLSAKSANAVLNAAHPEEDRSHLFTLTEIDQYGEDLYVLEFLVLPEVTESRSVGYEPVQPAQFPGAFQKYKGTESVQWVVNAILISRTTAEATVNLRNMNMLRGWTMPFFGENTATMFPGKLGAPPPVLRFKGLRESMIGEVPVVITSLNWSWPRDVDYIPAVSPDGVASNVPFPTVISIAIYLVESFSTTEFNQFDLDSYRMGDMIGAYGNKLPTPPDRSQLPVKQEAQAIQVPAPTATKVNLEDSSWGGRGKNKTRWTESTNGIKGVLPYGQSTQAIDERKVAEQVTQHFDVTN